VAFLIPRLGRGLDFFTVRFSFVMAIGVPNGDTRVTGR
jgi:hypothetical protein